MDGPAGGMRADAVGEDARGWQYFSLGGGAEDARLYRQLPPHAQKGKKLIAHDETDQEAPWEVATTTVEVLLLVIL